MNSPGTILKLWTKAVKKHEEGKKPDELPKKGQERKLKIKKGLTQLRVEAGNDMAGDETREAFEHARDRTAKAMQDYCRYLKSAKDEDKKALPKYLKTVKQLTVVVTKLDPGSLDPSEAEVGLDALDAVDEQDLAALDEALAQPAEDEEEQEPAGAGLAEEKAPPPAPPPPPNGEAAFNARLKALMPRVLEAQKANPAIANDLKLGVSEAHVIARKKDFVQATALLNKVERLLGGKTAAAPSGADVVKRFNALARSLKAALVAKGPDLARIQTLAGAVNGLLKNEDFAHASKVLDELEPLLRKEGGDAGKQESPGGDTELEAKFKQAKTELYAAVTRAAAASPAHKDTLIPLLGLASKHEKAKDFEAGLKVFAELREAVDEALAGGEEEEPLPEVKNLVTDGLAVWRAAQERVGAQISNLQGALRKTGDPDLLRIAEYGLNGLTSGLQVGLQAALLDYDRAAPEARAKAATRVGEFVGEYEAFVQDDPIIGLCDRNPFGVKVSIKATLGAAFQQLRKGLATLGS